MFFNAPVKPTKTKKKIYLVASTILGMLLSLLVYAFFEFSYLDWVASLGKSPNFDYDYFFWGLFLFLGAIGGFQLGKVWWRMVYVERVWAKGKRKNRK